MTVPKGLNVPSGKDLVLSDLTLSDTATTSTASDTKQKIQVPSSVLGSSELELKTGLLNQAAPQPGPHPELDPDVLAALDDDFDFDNPDNQILDDFVIEANSRPEGEAESDEEDNDNDSDADSTSAQILNDEEDYPEGFENDFGDEETKSRFTAYSMTSSVIRRSDGLKTVDDMFEKVYEEYDEEEMGDLGVDAYNEDVMGGFIEPNSERMQSMLKEYQDSVREQKERVATVFGEKDKDVMERARRVEEEDESEKGEAIDTILIGMLRNHCSFLIMRNKLILFEQKVEMYFRSVVNVYPPTLKD